MGDDLTTTVMPRYENTVGLDDQYARIGGKIGAALRIRLPDPRRRDDVPGEANILMQAVSSGRAVVVHESEIPVTPEMRSAFRANCPTGPHTVDGATLDKGYRAMAAKAILSHLMRPNIFVLDTAAQVVPNEELAAAERRIVALTRDRDAWAAQCAALVTELDAYKAKWARASDNLGAMMDGHAQELAAARAERDNALLVASHHLEALRYRDERIAELKSRLACEQNKPAQDGGSGSVDPTAPPPPSMPDPVLSLRQISGPPNHNPFAVRRKDPRLMGDT